MEKQKKSVLLEYIKVIIVTLLITYIALYFFQISRVYMTSMLPNYHEGEIVIVEKIFYKNSEPKYNDVIVIDYVDGEEKENYIIKRVIGIGGDHLEVKDNQLYRNGKEVEEKYVNNDAMTEDFTVDIPEGKVFVMGDNRNVSLDSRKFGYVDFKRDVIGKVIFSIF